jgi:hypothetical protein
MSTSVLSRRYRRLGSLLVGLFVVAGTLGNAALAGSGVSASASVDASVLVNAGMTPADATQAASQLNQAIDSAARNLAAAATGMMPSGTPVRSTAAATVRYANEVDAALTAFAVTSVQAIRATGASARTAVSGTLSTVGQLARALPGLVKVSAAATVKITGGNGGSTRVTIDATVDPAVRQLISGTVHGLQPLLPLTRATVRAVAAGVRQVIDALVGAVDRIIRATVDFAVAVVGTVRTVTQDALQGTRHLVESAAATTRSLVTAVDATLDKLRNPDISAQVDATLSVSASAH